MLFKEKSDKKAKGKLAEINTQRSETAEKNKEKEKEKDKKKNSDDNLEYDPEDDVWALEDTKASKGRVFAKSVIGALRLLITILTYMGLFPLIPKRNKKDGTYVCKFRWTSHATILFIFGFTLVAAPTIWLLIALVCISSNIPGHKPILGKTPAMLRSEEVYLMKRNAVNLIIIYTSFIHTTVCVMSIFLRRDYIAKQIVYWTEVVELLKLDVGKGVRIRVLQHLLVLLIFVAATTSLYFHKVSPMLAASGSMLYILLCRPFRTSSHWDSDMEIRKLVCNVLLLYIVIGRYLYILWFYYNCRILTNILRIWNKRFQYCLNRDVIESSAYASKEVREDMKRTNRTSRAQLFQDHLVIFNLIEGVNTQFQFVIESFYLSSMIMMIFESYGIIRGLFYYEYTECGSRRLDVIPTLLYVSFQLYMFLIVTLEASGVADEARNVLHIVRRKGTMTHKMDNELWFMMSMRLSFGGHEDVGIIGAGFFYITKSFLLGTISAITSHLIIFYQFEVPYSQTDESDANYVLMKKQDLIKILLNQTEGIKGTKC